MNTIKLKSILCKISLTFLLYIICFQTSAQSGQITCIAYKQLFYISGEWGEWPNHWTTYVSEGKPKPVVRVTAVDKGNVYRIQMFIDESVVSDLYVKYDPDHSEIKRDAWNDVNVYCYKDVNGDYIYTEGVSLGELTTNPSAWVKIKYSKMYFWILSEGYAIVFK